MATSTLFAITSNRPTAPGEAGIAKLRYSTSDRLRLLAMDGVRPKASSDKQTDTIAASHSQTDTVNTAPNRPQEGTQSTPRCSDSMARSACPTSRGTRRRVTPTSSREH